MNKLAIFVEGLTEVLFVKKLIEELAGDVVLIEHAEIRGGTKAARAFATVNAAKPNTGERYFVQIVDCGSDLGVKDRIREEHANLTASGFSKIIGLRDVFPKIQYADIPRLEAGLPVLIDQSLIPVEFILGVMEIESWFLSEHTHFPKIEARITVEAIRQTIGIDPENDDMQVRPNPALDLHECYRIGGRAYSKKGKVTKRTVDALDYAVLYLRLPQRIPYLDRFVQSLEAFFGLQPPNVAA